ncbi:MAG: 5'-nucleotidase [Lactococcus lactis]|nr:5'-nucleotidase [Lactococcus lactis]
MKLTILHTNNIILNSNNHYSLIGEIKERNKKTAEETLFLGATDINFSKSNYQNDEKIFLKKLKYDAIAIGEHQFDEGSQGLAKFLKQLDFPVLAANVQIEKDEILNTFEKNGKFLPYLLKESKFGKIGIFGLTPMSTVYDSCPSSDTIFTNPSDRTEFIVKMLKKKEANLIILLSQLGQDENQILAQKFPEIDVIIDRATYKTDKTINKWKKTLMVQTMADFPSIFELELEVDEQGKLLTAQEKYHEVFESVNYG